MDRDKTFKLDQDIDIVKLLKTIWEGKWVVAVLIVISFSVGWLYTTSIEQKKHISVRFSSNEFRGNKELGTSLIMLTSRTGKQWELLFDPIFGTAKYSVAGVPGSIASEMTDDLIKEFSEIYKEYLMFVQSDMIRSSDRLKKYIKLVPREMLTSAFYWQMKFDLSVLEERLEVEKNLTFETVQKDYSPILQKFIILFISSVSGFLLGVGSLLVHREIMKTPDIEGKGSSRDF